MSSDLRLSSCKGCSLWDFYFILFYWAKNAYTLYSILVSLLTLTAMRWLRLSFALFCTVLLKLNIYFNRSLWSTTNQTMIKCTQDLISLHNLIESILQTVILFALSAIKRIKIKQLKRLFESRNSVWKWIFLSLLFSKLSNRK